MFASRQPPEGTVGAMRPHVTAARSIGTKFPTVFLLKTPEGLHTIVIRRGAFRLHRRRRRDATNSDRFHVKQVPRDSALSDDRGVDAARSGRGAEHGIPLHRQSGPDITIASPLAPVRSRCPAQRAAEQRALECRPQSCLPGLCSGRCCLHRWSTPDQLEYCRGSLLRLR